MSRRALLAHLPIGIALALIAGVWVAGAVWSFEEQTRYARANGFHTPWLLPLVLDGMAVAMAAVSWAASLDARPAVFARLVTAVAIAASSASNGAWAWTRSKGDEQTIVLAAAVPVLAMLAFEVLLSEVRRQVLRRRGQPGPVAVAPPRLIRVALAPWSTLRDWRRLVLDATDPAKSFRTGEVDQAGPVHADVEPVEVDRERVDPWQWSTPVQTVPVHTEPAPVHTPPVRKQAKRSTPKKGEARSTRSTSQQEPPPRVVAMVEQLWVDYPTDQPGPESVNAVVNRYRWRKQDATDAVRIYRAQRDAQGGPVHVPDSPAELDRVAVLTTKEN
ncbi:DUF2637 domain-containing protein [Micromonospora purpureochromogenes]|uniref:DUF2637 domain-containing protein n=1 Tax=Micromonospora purpureochromogenes TaxID=47872 RepID=UPI0033D154D4